MGLKIRNTGGESPAIDLYGIVGEWGGILVDDLRAYLAGIKDTQEITVHLNTPGGSFSEGIAIYSNLARRKGDVHMIVDSEAHSAGSLIAQAGKTITMLNGSWMMIHEAQGSLTGQAKDFRDAANRLDEVNNQIVEIYKPRWKGSESDLRAALSQEKWMSDRDAVDNGLADRVGKSMAIAACADLSKFNYKNVPIQLQAPVVPESVLEKEREIERLCG